MTLDPDDHEIDLAAMFSEAGDRDPRVSPYGIVCTDHSAHARGSYASLWFDTPEDLLSFARRVAPAFAGIDYHDVAPQIEEILTVAEADGLVETQAEEIADLLGGAFRFRWWGTFDGLCSDPSEVACELRTLFHDHVEGLGLWDEDEQDEEDGVASQDDPERDIAPQEVEAFAVFLTELRQQG
jgi:hypothetical protein